MDEKEYRSALKSINPNQCVFEKAVFTTRCECQHAERFCLADRQGIECRNPLCLGHCTELLGLLRDNAKFLLHRTHIEGALPHASELKVQLGGLLGLQAVTFPELKSDNIHDVASTVEEARSRFKHFSELPMADIIQHLAHFKLRGRQKT
ncbi:MAG: hypothetical protein KDJ38_05560 [Gammaproteobacteria bacterium]|nr:hypothetical protein [Gammaproteobacteria bacterium]